MSEKPKGPDQSLSFLSGTTKQEEREQVQQHEQAGKTVKPSTPPPAVASDGGGVTPAPLPAPSWPPPAAVLVHEPSDSVRRKPNGNGSSSGKPDHPPTEPHEAGGYVASLMGTTNTATRTTAHQRTQSNEPQQQHLPQLQQASSLPPVNRPSSGKARPSVDNSAAVSPSAGGSRDAVVTPPPLSKPSNFGSFTNSPATALPPPPVASAALSSSPAAKSGGAGSAPSSPATKSQVQAPPPLQPPKQLQLQSQPTSEQIMDGRGLHTILQEFVRDCYRETPVDVVSYMAEWALRRRPPRPPSTPSSSPPVLGITSASPPNANASPGSSSAAAAAAAGGAGALATPARPSTHGSQRSSSTGGIMSLNLERPMSSGNIVSRRLLCIVLGADKSNKEQLLAMLDLLAPSEDGAGVGQKMGSALKDLLGSARDKVKAAGLDNVALVPCESDRMGGCIVFADLPSNELTRNLITLTAMADLACIVVSARHGVADMTQQRQGELYSRLLLAHSVGVKHAFVVLTDMRGVQPAVVENVEREVRAMFQRCGFDFNNLQIVHGVNSSDALFDGIARVQIQRRIPFTLKPVTRIKATMIVLFGAGIKVGDKLAVFSHGHFDVRVDAIPNLIDRKTHEVTDHNLGVLKRNQVATLELSVVGGGRPSTSISAPILAYAGGRVTAMGNVAEMFLDADDDDDDDDDDADSDDNVVSDEDEPFVLPAGDSKGGSNKPAAAPAADAVDMKAAREKQQRLLSQAQQQQRPGGNDPAAAKK